MASLVSPPFINNRTSDTNINNNYINNVNSTMNSATDSDGVLNMISPMKSLSNISSFFLTSPNVSNTLSLHTPTSRLKLLSHTSLELEDGQNNSNISNSTTQNSFNKSHNPGNIPHHINNNIDSLASPSSSQTAFDLTLLKEKGRGRVRLNTSNSINDNTISNSNHLNTHLVSASLNSSKSQTIRKRKSTTRISNKDDFVNNYNNTQSKKSKINSSDHINNSKTSNNNNKQKINRNETSTESETEEELSDVEEDAEEEEDEKKEEEVNYNVEKEISNPSKKRKKVTKVMTVNSLNTSNKKSSASNSNNINTENFPVNTVNITVNPKSKPGFSSRSTKVTANNNLIHLNSTNVNSKSLPTSSNVNSSNSLDNSYSRKDKSLGLLCENFLRTYSDTHSTKNKNISLDEAAKTLGVERRRIYDIVNIFESVAVVKRLGKNKYEWHGLNAVSDRIKELEFKLDEEECMNGGCMRRGMELMEYSLSGLSYDGQPLPVSKLHIHSNEKTKTPVDYFSKYLEIDRSRHGLAAVTLDTSTSAPTKKGPKGRDQSLGHLSAIFVQMFLASKTRAISLEDAARWILTAPVTTTKNVNNNIASTSSSLSHPTAASVNAAAAAATANINSSNHHPNISLSSGNDRCVALSTSPTSISLSTFKSKVRRLYDIANVLSSLRLIEKIHFLTTRRPAFKWTAHNVYPLISTLNENSYENANKNQNKRRGAGTRNQKLNDYNSNEEKQDDDEDGKSSSLSQPHMQPSSNSNSTSRKRTASSRSRKDSQKKKPHQEQLDLPVYPHYSINSSFNHNGLHNQFSSGLLQNSLSASNPLSIALSPSRSLFTSTSSPSPYYYDSSVSGVAAAAAAAVAAAAAASSNSSSLFTSNLPPYHDLKGMTSLELAYWPHSIPQIVQKYQLSTENQTSSSTIPSSFPVDNIDEVDVDVLPASVRAAYLTDTKSFLQIYELSCTVWKESIMKHMQQQQQQTTGNYQNYQLNVYNNNNNNKDNMEKIVEEAE